MPSGNIAIPRLKKPMTATRIVTPRTFLLRKLMDIAGLPWKTDRKNAPRSLCTRQAADYQVLRTIQTLYDKLPYVGYYSNDEGPIDFEKSYIWKLHKSCGVSHAEKDALAHICESDFDGEISSLIFRLPSTLLLAYSTLDSHTMTWMIL